MKAVLEPDHRFEAEQALRLRRIRHAVTDVLVVAREIAVGREPRPERQRDAKRRLDALRTR